MMDNETIKMLHVVQEKMQRLTADIQPALDSFSRLPTQYDFSKLSQSLVASSDFAKLSRDLLPAYDFARLSQDLFAAYDFTKLSRDLLASYNFAKVWQDVLTSYDPIKHWGDIFASYDIGEKIRQAGFFHDILADAIRGAQESLHRSDLSDFVDLPEGPVPANQSDPRVLESLLRVALEDLAVLARRVDALNWRDVIAIMALIIAIIQVTTSSDCSRGAFLP